MNKGDEDPSLFLKRYGTTKPISEVFPSRTDAVEVAADVLENLQDRFLKKSGIVLDGLHQHQRDAMLHLAGSISKSGLSLHIMPEGIGKGLKGPSIFDSGEYRIEENDTLRDLTPRGQTPLFAHIDSLGYFDTESKSGSLPFVPKTLLEPNPISQAVRKFVGKSAIKPISWPK